MEKIIAKEKITAVIHLAAYKAVGGSVEQPLKYYENNVGGLISLLQVALDKGVKNFIFSSSAAVYGSPVDDVVAEETACNPTSPYGWSKFMGEVILSDTCKANRDFKCVSLRYFNVVGSHESALIGELPKGKPQNLLPVIVQAAAKKTPPLTIFGNDYPTPDGTCLRDYIHVVDLAKAYVKALSKLSDLNGNYHTYNVGTGTPVSVLELIKTFEKTNGVKVPYKLGVRRPGDPAGYYASVKKAKQELGWQATKTIDDAVRDAWRWHQIIK